MRTRCGVGVSRIVISFVSVLAVAACGSATGVTTPATSSTSATPPPATAPATPAPTATPQPPLAVLESLTGVQVVDATGRVQWQMSQVTLNSLGSTDRFSPAGVVAAGDHVYVLADHISGGTEQPNTITVLDRTGKRIGSGTYDSAGGIAFDPSGARWAWSVRDPGTANTGRIMVAGVGMAAESVFSWQAPPDDSEDVGGWTDMGIVMRRLTSSGCGPGFYPDSASFLIDPTTGTLAPLITGAHYLDARHGTVVARSLDSVSDVIVNGTHYDEPGTIVDAAYASPDGSLVGIARLTPTSCTGAGAMPRVGTEMVTVGTGVHVDLSGCEIHGWFDAGHFVCDVGTDGATALADLSGNTVATLGTGALVGVLQGPG